MALVDYSASESSDEEEKPVAKRTTTPKATSNKPTFQKVVDRSEPHKIRVSLPEVSKPTLDGEESERPSKRAKIGSGGIGGFNAHLPTPKRAAAPNGELSLGGSRKGGLGSEVNLRTGAAPGFSREPELSISSVEEDVIGESEAMTGIRAKGDIAEESTGADATLVGGKPVEEPKPQSKPFMFKPLSVARKPRKKKAPPTGLGGTISETTNATQQSKAAPKLSLFSTEDANQTSRDGFVGKGTYQPLVYHTITLDPPPSVFEGPSEFVTKASVVTSPNASTAADTPPQSLHSIASDLNLSKSAKRQLLGRQKTNASSVNIVNFNTDEEYKANEDIRKSGEQVQHNAVRAIAPGKHSLKQLVNMGTAQAEALEESFASGRRNRSEAGNKYGW